MFDTKPLMRLTVCLVGLAFAIQAAAADRPNVLFIAVDDLRPELGCYGSPIAVTPNLDALASDGLLFDRAYCQQAICRPETTDLFHNYVSLRELQPDVVTLPQHFIANGYEAVYCGKIFHNGDTDEGKPFFLAMGYKLPHLNWCAPAKYWDLYDPSAIPMADVTESPTDGAAMGLHASFELRTRSGIPKTGPIGPQLSRTLKHAYLASTSYVDAQIGLLIKAVEDAGIRDNTIIVVWGDHGWHLGDMGVWGKATNYEIATRVPLMIWTPDMEIRGAKTDALVELVDIYPTLCELAGIPKPDHLEGHSFVPLTHDPNQAWKKAAFSQYPNPALREWAANPLSPAMRETWFGPLIGEVEERIRKQQGERWDRELFEQHLTGFTMRTDRYRLVVWKDRRDLSAEPLMVELYDHDEDPQETMNVAGHEPELVEELIKQLDAGWKSAL